jgi:hypothetical protein
LIILVEYFEITQITIASSGQVMRYYQFLQKEFMPDYSSRDYIRYKTLPIFSAGNNIKMIFSDTGKKEDQWYYSSKTKEDLIADGEARYKAWVKPKPNGGRTEAGEEGYAYNQELVRKIVELCLSHDIRPVLVATPITSILNNIYDERSPGFFDTFRRFAGEICERYPGLEFFDYSHDRRFEHDFSLFFDSDHLNAYGAEKFTPIVVADLEASGILKIPFP